MIFARINCNSFKKRVRVIRRLWTWRTVRKNRSSRNFIKIHIRLTSEAECFSSNVNLVTLENSCHIWRWFSYRMIVIYFLEWVILYSYHYFYTFFHLLTLGLTCRVLPPRPEVRADLWAYSCENRLVHLKKLKRDSMFGGRLRVFRWRTVI